MQTKAIRLLVVAATAAGLVCAAVPAGAQNLLHDHLKCYKIADPHRYLARADLTPLQTQFPAEPGCQIRVHSLEFCIPVNKDRIPGDPNDPREAPSADVVGQDLTNDFLCYRLRCPMTTAQPPASLKVSDQFGTRDIVGWRPMHLCVPAIKGEPPTTTTTTTTMPTLSSCGQATAPMCDGTCPTAEACVDVGGFCACVPSDQLCGQLAGPPQCYGACPPTQVCAEDGTTGTCTCQ